MIIARYLQKEVLQTLIGVALVLLLILLSNQFVRYLSMAAAGKIAPHFLLQLLGFEIPYLLALLLPLGLFLSIILAYGRLYAESEMPVLHACGFNRQRLMRMTGGFAIGITAVVVILTFWINPMIAQKQSLILAQGMAEDSMLDTVMPGRFQVTHDGRRVIYVEQMSRNRQTAHNIFFAQQSPVSENNWVIVSATQGFQSKDKNSEERFLVATDGYRYEGVPGQNDYKIIQFKKYSMRIPHLTHNNRQIQEALPTQKLWKNYANPESAAELQWRFALPISTFLLALLAVPLSDVKPRQGRYSMLFPALLVYVIYMNLLFVGRNWIEQRSLSVDLGLWWVHVLLLGVVLLIILSRSRWARRFFGKTA